jgi:hypothetical protein
MRSFILLAKYNKMRLRWTGHVAPKGEKIKLCRILDRKKNKRLLERTGDIR